MKHIVVTRASFEEYALFEEYLPVIKNLYIPCILGQTSKNFDLCLIVNKQHVELIEKEFKDAGIYPIMLVGNVSSYNKWILENPYDIQTRHDCDDWMSPIYIETIQSEYHKNITQFEEFLIQAQPVKMSYETGYEYRMNPYTQSRTSMFLSLCQKECKKSMLQEQHGHFPKLVPNVVDIGYGFTKWVAHGKNISAKIEPTDIKIEKVTIISSIFGNLNMIKSCLSTWFPLPVGWEVCLYDNEVSKIDGTSEYLDELQKIYKFKIVRDGKIRSHPDAINVLMKEVNTEWVLHLDSDVELRDRNFYKWAENTIGKDKIKVWGVVEKYNSSKFKRYPETPNYYTLHLPRAAPYILLFNKKFYDEKNIDFGNIVIEGGTIKSGRGEIMDSLDLVPSNSMIRVTGDTAWKIYWESFRHNVFFHFSSDIWKCWSHKEASSRKWMKENADKIKKMKQQIK
jgi:hypothetical protein